MTRVFAAATMFAALLLITTVGSYAAVNHALSATAIADSEWCIVQPCLVAGYVNDGNPATRWGSTGVGWVELDWATPKTFNTITVDWYRASWQVGPYYVRIWNSDANDWQDIGPILGSDGVNAAPYNYVRTLSFSPVTTTKLRIEGVTIWEVGVYNNPNWNLAKQGTATASSTDGNNVPANGIDEDRATRWAATPEDMDRWFQVEWATPQDFNTVILRIYENPGEPDTQVQVDYWDSASSSFEYLTAAGDGLFPLDPVINLPVTLPSPTTKIRITKLKALVDVELYDFQTVSGTVYRDTTPVGCVTVQGGYEATQSDEFGLYSVQAPVGDITLVASAEGYEELEQNVTVPQGGTTQDLFLTRIATDLVASASGASASSSAEGAGPEGAIDGQPCTHWTGTEGLWDGGWLVIEWPSNQTVDKVVARHGNGAAMDVDVWKNGSWTWVAHTGSRVTNAGLKPEVSFAPQSTSKIRIRHLFDVTGVEAYNLAGPAPVENVSGTVLSGRTGAPLANALVTADSTSCYTSEAGEYFLSLPAGAATINVTRPGYDDASQAITVPATGSLYVPDIALPTLNIAPQATATASAEQSPVLSAAMANDDNFDTRFAAPDGPNGWYQLEWPQAVTIDKVRLHQLCDPGGSWGMTWMAVDYWDGSAWQQARRVDGIIRPTWVIEAQFLPVTTTKVRIRGVISAYDVEVLTATSSIVTGTIPEIRALADGAAVQTSGTLTALFPDCGYIEDPGRVAGIKVTPPELFISGSSENLATSGTASASTQYAGLEAPYGIDGSMSTRFSHTAGGAGEWYQVDWSTPQTFNKVVLWNFCASWNSGPFTLQVWQDGGWQTVGTFITALPPDPNGAPYGTAVAATYTFPTLTTDKVKVLSTVTFFEFEVYRQAEPAIDYEVTVTGVLSTSGKERVLNAQKVSVGAQQPVTPVGVVGKSLSVEQSKLSTIALLTRTAGPVVGSFAGYAYIDDGSGLPTDITNVTGLRVQTEAYPGEYLAVTGIAGATDISGDVMRAIRPRAAADIAKLKSRGENLALTGTATASDQIAGYEAPTGIDGNMATRFSHSSGGAGCWFEIDWATPQTFNQVVMYNFCASWNSGPYTLQIWNGSDWTDVTTFVTQLPPYPNGNPMYAFPYGSAVSAVATFATVTTSKLRVVNTVTFFELGVYKFD